MTGPTVFETPGALQGQEGTQLGPTDWLLIDQDRVNGFADVTGDHQWIHVDVERAKDGPFGGTIAHGFLTLSLIPKFSESAIKIQNVRMGVNYGLNRVRFMGPVPAGSRVRAALTLLKAEPIENGGRQLTWEVTTEREGVAKPVCIAESIARLYA